MNSKHFILVVFSVFSLMISSGSTAVSSTSDADEQFRNLRNDLKIRTRFERFAPETFHPQALIHSSDRDPLDILTRRTRALLEDLKTMTLSPKLNALELQLEAIEAEERNTRGYFKRKKLFHKLHSLRRQIAFANPLLDFDQLLFIKRDRATFNHMCDQYYGVNASSGGGLFVLENPFTEATQERNLLADSLVESGRLKGQKLNEDIGGFLSPELSYDGKTVLFAYVEGKGSRDHIEHLDHLKRGHWNRGRSYHLFSVNSDGSKLSQLTDGTWNDFDPCFLPNGRVAFISERRGGYLRCGRACPSYTVFDMNPDGSDIRVLSPHENNEWQPSVDNEGMIIYTRWDYVDRHGCTAHHPWRMTPDGRDSRDIHGNYSIKENRADMEMDLRAIPDSHKLIGAAVPHHGQTYGSLVMIDPSAKEDDGMGPVKRITPDVGFPESQEGKQVYGTPWALNENYYLCVYDPGMKQNTGTQGAGHQKGNYGIYLVDAFGNKILIHRATDYSLLSPIPLRPRDKPPIIPETTERLSENPSTEGTMAVLNVYESLKPWPEDRKIKALRIYQTYPMSVPSGNPPHETGRRVASASDSVNLARSIIGTVPVEDDGSAYFKVPSLKELYFQAVDEEGLAIQSMRSATWVQPGEQLVCAGCHEPKGSAPEVRTGMPKALNRAPSTPKPDVQGTRPFSYPQLVQPVLDRNCLPCHQTNEKKGAPPLDSKVVTAYLPTATKVYRSYASLIHEWAFWDYGDPYRTTPGRFGAAASRLYQMLKEGHHGVELSKEDMHRLTVWLDSVSNFYGVYEKEGGEAQLRGETVYPTLE